MYSWLNAATEVFQINIHGGGVCFRHEPTVRLACAWTDGAENINPLVVGLAVCPGPLAAFAPNTCQRTLLAEARFVFEPDLDTFVRVDASECFQTGVKFFLKSDWA